MLSRAAARRRDRGRTAPATSPSGRTASTPSARFRTQLAPTSGAMGYGVPAAIAAKIAEPERTVVCLAGDGDFLMSGQELATADARGRRRCSCSSIDNGMFGTIRMHQERDYPGRVTGDCPDEPRLRRLRPLVRRPRRDGRAHGRVRAGAGALARGRRHGPDPPAASTRTGSPRSTTLSALRRGRAAAPEIGERMRDPAHARSPLPPSRAAAPSSDESAAPQTVPSR